MGGDEFPREERVPLPAGHDLVDEAGSRLRSNETLGYRVKLPKPLYRIDAEPSMVGRDLR